MTTAYIVLHMLPSSLGAANALGTVEVGVLLPPVEVGKNHSVSVGFAVSPGDVSVAMGVPSMSTVSGGGAGDDRVKMPQWMSSPDMVLVHAVSVAPVTA